MPLKTELRSKLKGNLIDYESLINEIINDQSFNALLSLISDKNECVRLRASYIITSIARRIPKLIDVFYPKLLELLNSEDEGIRVAANFAIEKFKEIINQNASS